MTVQTAPISFTEAFDSPALFGKWFSPRESWATWRVVGKALFGEPMTPEDLETFSKYTGRTIAPTEPVSEFWAAVGRRGGKGWFAAALVVYLACLREHHLKRGELGRVMCLAADRDQAGETFRYVAELIDSIPVLAGMVTGRTKESIDLNNDIQITVQTASFRRIRGRKVIACVLDEISFWFNDETSANPDSEILTALRPSMMNVEGALLIAISSPYAKRGSLWEMYREHYGRDGDDVLVWRASTTAMHPTADRKFLAREEAKDPVSFRAEYLAEFRDDVGAYVTPEVVDECIVKGRVFLPFVSGKRYTAFCDPAGGSGGDSLTIGIATDEAGKSVVARVVEWRPPFQPTVAVREVAEVLKEYRLERVTGDRFSGGIWRDLLRTVGIAYVFSERTKSDLFGDFLPVLNSRRVELPDPAASPTARRLINQLLGLERTTSRLGKDTIGHSRGQWDDLINAAAGACVLAQKRPMLKGYEYSPPAKPKLERQQGSVHVQDITLKYRNCSDCGQQHLAEVETCPQRSWSWGLTGPGYGPETIKRVLR